MEDLNNSDILFDSEDKQKEEEEEDIDGLGDLEGDTDIFCCLYSSWTCPRRTWHLCPVNQIVLVT